MDAIRGDSTLTGRELDRAISPMLSQLSHTIDIALTDSPRKSTFRKLTICAVTGVCLVIAFSVLFLLTGGRNVSALEQARLDQAQKYMTSRIAGQYSDAEVEHVLQCFMLDGSDKKPVIDVQAPAAARWEGRAQIKQYLQKKPRMQSYFKEGSITDPKLVDGKVVVRFVMHYGGFGRRDDQLAATFTFDEDSSFIQEVTIRRDTSKPLTDLEKNRQRTVRKYMEGRIQAFQGADKAAGVAQVLECFASESSGVTPTIDIHAPKKELAEGTEQIKKYLKGGPVVPCYFQEGSNTDPDIVDSVAVVNFVLRLGTKTVGKDMLLLAIFEFRAGSALVTKVTVIQDA